MAVFQRASFATTTSAPARTAVARMSASGVGRRVSARIRAASRAISYETATARRLGHWVRNGSTIASEASPAANGRTSTSVAVTAPMIAGLRPGRTSRSTMWAAAAAILAR